MTTPFDNLRKRRFTDIEKEALFRRNKKVINRVVRDRLSKTKRIVHGARATNAQLPRFLERKATVDWDVFAKNPKKAAREMERALDRKFGGDFFRVKKGKTKKLKVNKVVSNVTDEAFVDFSVPNRKVPWIAKRGVRFASLRDQFEKAKRTVAERTAPFRREKDLSLIRRVRKFEKLKRDKL